MVERIVSGGQTGADRGGLEAARALGIPHGGWCPRGRRAEDGRIPAKYDLQESASEQYHVRTRCNVRDSDGTILFTRGPLSGGCLRTAQFAEEMRRPLLIVELGDVETDTVTPTERLRTWLKENRIRTLNVAGPRESKAPGAEASVVKFLTRALVALRQSAAYSCEDRRDVAAEAPASYRRRVKRS